MQVGTYPTRNFAHIALLALHRCKDQTISYPTFIGLWRIVVEDFRFLGESFLLIDSTEQIFTLSELLWVERVLSDTWVVPAYSQIFISRGVMRFSKRRIFASLWQLVSHHRTVHLCCYINLFWLMRYDISITVSISIWRSDYIIPPAGGVDV